MSATIVIPRASGYAHVHLIPESVVSANPSENYYNNSDEQAIALEYLFNIKADLLPGDFVLFEAIAGYRNSGLNIFNGTSIISLEDTPDDYGTLPSQFHVIENGVPTSYWHGPNGICHNGYINFDISSVRDECLNHITYGLLDQVYAIYTTFEFQGRIYRIIYDYTADHSLASQEEAYDEDNLSIDDSTIVDTLCDEFHVLLVGTPQFLCWSTSSYRTLENESTLFLEPTY